MYLWVQINNGLELIIMIIGFDYIKFYSIKFGLI